MSRAPLTNLLATHGIAPLGVIEQLSHLVLEPGNGVDRFGLKLTNPRTGESAVVVSTRFLAGGNIQLHKPNPSTTGPAVPPDEITACGSDDSGLGQ